MSDAGSAVKATLIAALTAEPELADVGVYAGDAPAGVLPRIEVQEPVAADWSTKDWQGRELRTGVIVRAASGQDGRLPALRAAAEAAAGAIAGEIGGWRVASAVFLRSRTADERNGTRTVLIEHRVRVMQD